MTLRSGATVVAAPAPPRVRAFAHGLPDGSATTVHAVAYPLALWRPRAVRLDPPRPLASWCVEAGVREALVGGFFARPDAVPLGELWIAGEQQRSVPFVRPHGAGRACVSIEAGRVAVARRSALPERPRGDLLQAGPLLVAGGRPIVADGDDPEGFSSGAAQFDSDITVGRYPRAALGLTGSAMLAVACDGRSTADAGLTLAELARLLVALGARVAINLDGGGSTSLVTRGRLANVPREEHGIELLGGRPVSTALAFEPR
jgi:hypothetical protein